MYGNVKPNFQFFFKKINLKFQRTRIHCINAIYKNK